MVTDFRSRRDPEPRSGGKMVRARRAAGARTPYERPRLTNPGAPQNPSWLSRLLYSPTRMIASGAGKLLSTVFSPESSPSSSSASSSEGDLSSSEDDVENDNNDISTRKANGLIQRDGLSKMIKRFRKEPQTPVGKSETKSVIEKLLMQETFSREECDQLTMIIKSRVVDYPTTEDVEDGRPREILNKTIGSDMDMPDLCSTAVREAKKWLKEKKLTDSKSEFDHGTCSLNSVMALPDTEVEVGSPVDMARSYMRGRPPWASPSANHIEFKSQSPIGIQLFNEETPYSIGGNSASSKLKRRGSSGTGSWNIQEEIRRVRSKATEEMLRTLPSSKIDWSAFALEHKSGAKSLVTENLEDGKRDKMHDSAQPIDASLNLAIEQTTSHGFPVSMIPVGLRKEILLHKPAINASEQNQELEATQINEGKGLQNATEGILNEGERMQLSGDMETVSPGDAGPVNVDALTEAMTTNEQDDYRLGGTIQESALDDRRGLPSKEVAGTASALAANGFPSSGFSLSAGRDNEQNDVPRDEEHNNNSSGYDKIATGAPMEVTCELLSEASIEVPNVNENDSIADASLDSSGVQYEELSEDQSQPSSKQSEEGKANLGQKISRYNRRGRGRGRGRGK